MKARLDVFMLDHILRRAADLLLAAVAAAAAAGTDVSSTRALVRSPPPGGLRGSGPHAQHPKHFLSDATACLSDVYIFWYSTAGTIQALPQSL